MGKLPKLTAKQMVFVTEYKIDGNGTRSAIVAGYSENTASVMATENLRKPNIQAHLTAFYKELNEKSECKLSDAVDRLEQIINAQQSDYYICGSLKPLNQWPNPRAVQSFDFEKNWIKLYDPVRAIEQASRLCGWDQRLQENDKELNINIKYVGRDDHQIELE